MALSALVIGALGAITLYSPTIADIPIIQQEPQEPLVFVPVMASPAIAAEVPSPPPVERETSKPQRTASPTQRPKPKATLRPAPIVPVTRPASHSMKGYASWYCKAGISICHFQYPPGSMVAAACAPLRAVLPNYAGRMVTVTGPYGAVEVQLVDFCASTSKVIDLYFEPMRQLGGSGVLPVTVSW
jgi:hypothetical protein